MKIARISGTLRTKLYSCTDVDLQDGGGPVMQAELDPKCMNVHTVTPASWDF